MADDSARIELSRAELREVAGFAVRCAGEVVGIFEGERPGDGRVRGAIEVARVFAGGGERCKAMRDGAWGAQRAAIAAREVGLMAASEAARAGMAAAGAGFLHPLAKGTQVKHILGAAGHAARAVELAAGDDRGVGEEWIGRARGWAGPVVVGVLRRYPAAPGGGGRVGELIRGLDVLMR